MGARGDALGWDVVVGVRGICLASRLAGRHSDTPCSPSHKMAALNALNICMEEMESTSKKLSIMA